MEDCYHLKMAQDGCLKYVLLIIENISLPTLFRFGDVTVRKPGENYTVKKVT